MFSTDDYSFGKKNASFGMNEVVLVYIIFFLLNYGDAPEDIEAVGKGIEMWKKKGDVSMIKKHKIMASVALIILICGAIYLYRMMFPRYKVVDKEAATAFVLEHQTELNELVSHMKEEYERGEGKDVIIMIRKEEFHADEYIKKNSWLKRYRIRSISIHKIYEQYQVCIAFIDAPSSYEYFEVYYAEDDEPLGWGDDTELVEEREGIYVQRGSYYVYETEKITDHWYYYQCRT